MARLRKTGRLARWAVRLSAFKFVPLHIRGTDNVIADALSRMFEPSEEAEVDSSLVNSVSLMDFPVVFEDLKVHQSRDPSLATLVQRLIAGEKVGNYLLKQGLLYCIASFDRKPKIVLPTDLVPMVFRYYHESAFGAHLGIFKTINKIRSVFIWPKMDADIRTRIRGCEVCALSKPALNTKIGLLASEVPSCPMERLYIDFIGKLPRSRAGNAFALVVVDGFSKFSWIFPLREATTARAVGALKSIFAWTGPPQYLVSDNARQFTSRAFRNFCFQLGIRHVTTSPYYPKPNHSERFNRNLKTMLIAYHHDDHTSWDTQLDWLQFAFNTARHEAHQHVPFHLFFGFEPNTSLSNSWSIGDLLPDSPRNFDIAKIWESAHRELLRAHDRSRRRYDKGRRPHSFKVGDRVMLTNHPVSRAVDRFAAKLAPRFLGPFVISEIYGNVNVRLTHETLGYQKRAHVSQIKSLA